MASSGPLLGARAGRTSRQGENKRVAGEENRRFLASARSRFLIEPFQFERVDAFGLNVGGMKLRRRGLAMAWDRGTPGRGVDQDERRGERDARNDQGVRDLKGRESRRRGREFGIIIAMS